MITYSLTAESKGVFFKKNKSLQAKAEAHLEPKGAFMMDLNFL